METVPTVSMTIAEIRQKYIERDDEMLDDWRNDYNYKGIEQRVAFLSDRLFLVGGVLSSVLKRLEEAEAKQGAQDVQPD